MDLSIAIPAFNEAACLREVIENLHGTLSNGKMKFELIIVDNGSTDDTPRIATELADRHAEIRVLHLIPNQGYGGAILSGFQEASGEIVGFTCGDGEVGPRDVMRFYEMLRATDLELCKGKRINRQDGLFRKLMSVGYHLLVSVFFKLHTTDINGYPVLIKRGRLLQLSLTRRDWMVNLDLLKEARKARLRTAEVDVMHLPRAGGRSHVRWYFPIVFFLQLLRFWSKCRR